MQLPNAASLERTNGAAREVEKILADTPGVEYTTSVIGFSLLSYVQTSYNAFFFVVLKPWTPASKGRAVSGNQEQLKSEAKRAFPREPLSASLPRLFPASAPRVASRLSLRTGAGMTFPILPTTSTGSWLPLASARKLGASALRSCQACRNSLSMSTATRRSSSACQSRTSTRRSRRSWADTS